MKTLYNRLISGFQQKKKIEDRLDQLNAEDGVGALDISRKWSEHHPPRKLRDIQNFEQEVLNMLKQAHSFKLPENGSMIVDVRENATGDKTLPRIDGGIQMPFKYTFLEWEHSSWEDLAADEFSINELGLLIYSASFGEIVSFLREANASHEIFAAILERGIRDLRNMGDHNDLRSALLIPTALMPADAIRDPGERALQKAVYGDIPYISAPYAVFVPDLDNPVLKIDKDNEDVIASRHLAAMQFLLTKQMDKQKEDFERYYNQLMSTQFQLRSLQVPLGTVTTASVSTEEKNEGLNNLIDNYHASAYIRPEGSPAFLYGEVIEDFYSPLTYGYAYWNILLEHMSIIASRNIHPEIEGFTQFSLMLRCRNIEVVKRFTPSQIKRTFAAAGLGRQLAQRSYALRIKGREQRIDYEQPGSPTGKRVKTHWRRGHIRRYANGHEIFIDETIVNPGNIMPNSRDYKVDKLKE